jgi:hypothetical protein
MRASIRAAALAVCGSFTVGHVAWADEPQPEEPRLDDPRAADGPLAPHYTTGPTIRAGTSVGHVYGNYLHVFALGGSIAAGHRWGRIAVEGELGYLDYQELGPSSLSVGHALRIGVIGRAEVLRFGSEWVGANSMFSIYVEGGVARQRDTWYRGISDPDRSTWIVPASGTHTEGTVGLGILLDHRLEQPSRLSRVGWMLGWRAVATPEAPESYMVCRGTSCAREAAAEVEMPMARETARSLLFTSSLTFTW